MIRLFAAIAVPEEIAEPLARRQQPLPGARWRPLGTLHITLRFFGEVREDVADDLDSALSVIAVSPFALSLEGVGVFGEGAWSQLQPQREGPRARLRRLAHRPSPRRDGDSVDGVEQPALAGFQTVA